MFKIYSSPFTAKAWRRAALAAALLGGASTGAAAQSLNYSASVAKNLAGTYTDLGTAGTAIATANTDDANSAATDIGFSFSYNGTAFTQFVLNTNGLLRLGAAAPSSVMADPIYGQTPENGPINSTNAADVNLLMPFNFDLTAGTSTPEYRVATTGTAGSRICTIQWKNVADKAVLYAAGGTSLPTQYTNFSFQVKLYEGSNQIDFVYSAAAVGATSALKYAVVGLKGSGNAAGQDVLAVKASASAWSTTTFATGPQQAASTANAHNFRSVAPPDAGRTYRFTQAIPNDAELTTLYNIEQLPVGQAYGYQVIVTNVGTTAITNPVVTLSITGANTVTQTQQLSGLAVGSQTTITFSSVTFAKAGTNNVTVSLSSDANSDNNTQTAITLTAASTTTTAATFSYIKPNVASTNSFGFGYSATTGGFTSAFCAAYTATTAFKVNVVRAVIGNDAASVGQTVYGVLLDINGNLLGQSPNYVLTSADLGVLHTFTLSTPVSVPAGQFLVGLAQVVSTAQYYPMAVQTEMPTRANTFFGVGISPAATPFDISTNPTPLNIRYLVEAGGFGTALATASPALARAIAVYPNPSATGFFSLDINGLSAPNNLAVDVTNQLGQVVYRGTASNNATTPLDLSGLSAGFYHLQVRNGDEFTSRQVSIIK